MKEELIEFCKSMGIEYVGIASSGRYNDLRDILQRGLIEIFQRFLIKEAWKKQLSQALPRGCEIGDSLLISILLRHC